MRPAARGLLLAALHLTIVASLGGKLLLDRALRPRVWVRAAPADPDLPIRGRYVQLRVELPQDLAGAPGPGSPQVLAYFIPEHVPDPSLRPPGEELWVEVTIPRHGPPRPIRLAVKKDGKLTALVF
jgi:hypothetical protein